MSDQTRGQMQQLVTLESIAKIITGNTPKTSVAEYYDARDIPFFKPSDIAEGAVYTLKDSESFLSSAAADVCRVAPLHSILCTCIGTVGKIGILTREAAFNQQINAVVLDETIADPEYIAYAMLSQVPKMREKANAAVVPIINKSSFARTSIPLPSLDTQRSIRKQLNSVQRRIDDFGKQDSALELLVKSRFVEMFGDPETNRMGWRVVDLGKVLTTSPQNGLYKPQKCYSDDGGGVPIVRIDSFRQAGPDVRALRRLECSQDEVERYGLRVGDVLINRVNSPGNMGKTMGVYDLSEPVVFESNMMRMHPDETVVATRFLVTYMTTPYGKRHFESHAKKAVNQASINQGDVASLPVMLPPLELQRDYLTFVAQVDKSRFAVQQAIEQLELLKAKLMQEYFG